MKQDFTPQKVEPQLGQETQELLGMLSDHVSRLTHEANNGSADASAILGLVRDEVYSIIADVKLSADGNET
jgi:hypothetical protein